jgi:hypothetical protein
MDDSVLHDDVLILESGGGIDKLRSRERDPINPFGITRAIQQDEVSLLEFGNHFCTWNPERRVLIPGSQEPDIHQRTPDALGEIGERIIHNVNRDPRITSRLIGGRPVFRSISATAGPGYGNS